MSATVKNGAFFVSRTKDAFSLSISCKQDNVLGGVSVAVGEVERARQHGLHRVSWNVPRNSISMLPSDN